MILSCRLQAADYFRFELSWFVSQSGSLPPSFSSLIRSNLTSESSYLSKRHDRSADNSWFQPNGQPISPVPQKWRNCEGKISAESRHSVFAREDCKDELLRFRTTAQLSLLGQRKISRTRNGGAVHVD